MRPMVALVLAVCFAVPGVPLRADGPVARSVTAHARRLAADRAVSADAARPTGAVELRWSELAPVIAGQDVTLQLSDGSAVRGEVLVVRDDALVIARPASRGRTAGDGAEAIIQRTLLQTITVRKTRGSWGRHLGTVIGVLNGVVLGGYIAGSLADSAETGVPLFLALASGMTMAGYYTGRRLDERLTVIRVVP
jgi:hypothetical protein